MKYFHPKRQWRRFLLALRRVCFIYQCKIHNVACHVGNNSLLRGCRVASNGSGGIYIGDNCTIRNCTFGFYGASGKIIVGEGSTINARPDARTGLYVKDGTSITLGERCLVSNSVEIATTDWHRIVDGDGHMLNDNRDVFIGEHVCICRRVLIGKGVSIGSDSVVGAGSIVIKGFSQERVLIAGNPAVVKKQNISWK